MFWRTDHKDSCLQRRAALLPSGVIDVEPRDGFQEKFIYTSNREEAGSYVVSSHCWGQGADRVPTALNLISGMHEVKLTEIPCTVKDAISVTKGIGSTYV